jgi:hypothetical protein
LWFDWIVPGTAPQAVSLLAIITADNDSIATSERNIAALVTGSKKCGVKNTTVINPPPGVGPVVRALRLDVGAGGAKTSALELDRASASMIRAVVLSRRLSALAKKAKLKTVRLRAEEKDELARLIQDSPRLKRQLDVNRAYKPHVGTWLANIRLRAGAGEPIVILVDPESRRGYASVTQRADDGSVVGGFTLQSIRGVPAR